MSLRRLAVAAASIGVAAVAILAALGLAGRAAGPLAFGPPARIGDGGAFARPLVSPSFAPLEPSILDSVLGPGAGERLLGLPAASRERPGPGGGAVQPGPPPSGNARALTPRGSPPGTTPNLRIWLAAEPRTVRPGGSIRYTITVVNVGSGRANTVRVTSPEPGGTSFVTGNMCAEGRPASVGPGAGAGGLPAVQLCIPTDPDPVESGPVAWAEYTWLNPGEMVVSWFEVLVDVAVPQGTVITNHANVWATNVARRTSTETRTPVN